MSMWNLKWNWGFSPGGAVLNYVEPLSLKQSMLSSKLFLEVKLRMIEIGALKEVIHFSDDAS
jgi:hypothetical protein